MNLQQNSGFMNWMRFPLLCEKSGAILLVLVWVLQQAGRLAGQQSDKILVDFEILTDRIVKIFTEFNKGTVLL